MKHLLLLIIFPAVCFGQNLKENSIGLAKISGYEGIEGSHMVVDIAFPTLYLNSENLTTKKFEQTPNINRVARCDELTPYVRIGVRHN